MGSNHGNFVNLLNSAKKGLKKLDKRFQEKVGFDQLIRKLHMGTLFKDGWYMKLTDAVQFKSDFQEYIHFPEDADIDRQLNRLVTPYPLDIASIRAFYID